MRYVALFAGPNIRNARIVCAVTDPEIVAEVARAGLRNIAGSSDPVLVHLAEGNRNALVEVLRGTEKKRRG